MHKLVYKLQIENENGEQLLSIEAPTEELLLEKLGAYERGQANKKYHEEIRTEDLPF